MKNINCDHLEALNGSIVACKLKGNLHVDRCLKCEHYAGPSRGGGDTLHKTFAAVGITEERVKKVIGTCACPQLRKTINDLFPYGTGETKSESQ